MPQPPDRGTTDAPAALGKYKLLRQLGHGGMGVVYEAIDTALGRKVALKLMIQTLHADPQEAAQEKERFLREGHLAAALPKHAHIVGIYETGIISGERYLAMEFIDGAPMSEWAKRGNVSTRDQVALLRDTALAVHHAHEHGVIHRDLKPANILVDTQSRPHVTDFGLAKMVGPKAQVSLTGSGFIVGTPAYISPEQARGLKTVDRRTDVYALGVVLYEILAGRPPFEGQTALDILLKAMKSPAPAPSSFMRRGIDLETTRALEKICLKCLAKNPGDRYPTAQALAADLDRWLHGEEVRVTLPPTRRNTLRRSPSLALVATLAAVLLGVGAVAFLFLDASGKRGRDEDTEAQARKVREDRDRAERERKSADERAREAERQLQALRAKAIPAIAGKDRNALRAGAIGEYFTGTNFDLLAVRRVDAQIRLDGNGASWPGGPTEFFTVRWTAFVDASETAPYLFQVRGGDGARLFVDMTELLSDWTAHASSSNSRVVLLEKGLHRISVEHLQLEAGSGFSFSFGPDGGAPLGLIHDPSDFAAVSGRTTPDASDHASLPGAQEAEALKVLEAGGGGTFLLPFGRGKGSIVWGPTVKPADRLKLMFTAPEAQRRTVILALTRNKNHGIFRISVNGQVVADALDLCHARGHFLEFEFRNVELRKGANELEFVVVGKNVHCKEWTPGNGYYKLGFDYLRLR